MFNKKLKAKNMILLKINSMKKTPNQLVTNKPLNSLTINKNRQLYKSKNIKINSTSNKLTNRPINFHYCQIISHI